MYSTACLHHAWHNFLTEHGEQSLAHKHESCFAAYDPSWNFSVFLGEKTQEIFQYTQRYNLKPLIQNATFSSCGEGGCCVEKNNKKKK